MVPANAPSFPAPLVRPIDSIKPFEKSHAVFKPLLMPFTISHTSPSVFFIILKLLVASELSPTQFLISLTMSRIFNATLLITGRRTPFNRLDTVSQDVCCFARAWAIDSASLSAAVSGLPSFLTCSKVMLNEPAIFSAQPGYSFILIIPWGELKAFPSL